MRFANGRTLRLGEEMGGLRDDVWRTQIRHTVKRHLDKELQVRGRGIKVLSLFFIDRVANYRDSTEGAEPAQGKFARAFEEELASLARDGFSRVQRGTDGVAQASRPHPLVDRRLRRTGR